MFQRLQLRAMAPLAMPSTPRRCFAQDLYVDLKAKTQFPGNNTKKYRIQTHNKISPVGLSAFKSAYTITNDAAPEVDNPHAIMIRSYKLQEEEVLVSRACRA